MSDARATIVGYVYPKRNELYQNLVDKVPPKRNQRKFRTLFMIGWKLAREEVDIWVEDSGGIVAHQTGHIDATVPQPIQDKNNDTSAKVQYRIYLDPAKAENPALAESMKEAIQYWVALPSDRSRQVFIRVALVRGMQEVEKVIDIMHASSSSEGISDAISLVVDMLLSSSSNGI